MVRGKGFRIAVVVLLVVVYLVLSKMVAMRGYRHALPAPEERPPFRVDFTLPDVQGHLVRLVDLRGRPVLINIWATWCYPCREEMPSMNALYKDYSVRAWRWSPLRGCRGETRGGTVPPGIRAHLSGPARSAKHSGDDSYRSLAFPPVTSSINVAV